MNVLGLSSSVMLKNGSYIQYKPPSTASRVKCDFQAFQVMTMAEIDGGDWRVGVTETKFRVKPLNCLRPSRS